MDKEQAKAYNNINAENFVERLCTLRENHITMGLVKLFHYTDYSGFKGIKSAGKIRMSGNGAFGPGVYFTDLSPSKYDKEGISLDCFTGKSFSESNSLTT